MKVYCNGNLCDRDKLGEVFEPGFLFGWGNFEVLRSYKKKIPFLDLHIRRLNSSLELLGLEEVNLDWEKEIKNLLFENNLKDAYVRITTYKKRKGTGTLIYADKFAYYTSETYEKGFTAIISPHQRMINDINTKVKSLSYANNRVSWFCAQKKGKDEALVLNHQGFLVGGSRSNLFLVKDKGVITPSGGSGAFRGITKQVIFRILKDLDIKIREEKVTLEDLYSCQEAFISSALMEAMPLVECESKLLGNGKPGEITLKVLSKYRETAHG